MEMHWTITTNRVTLTLITAFPRCVVLYCEDTVGHPLYMMIHAFSEYCNVDVWCLLPMLFSMASFFIGCSSTDAWGYDKPRNSWKASICMHCICMGSL
jgi:hypothetical protein